MPEIFGPLAMKWGGPLEAYQAPGLLYALHGIQPRYLGLIPSADGGWLIIYQP